MSSNTCQRDLYFRLKIKLATNRFDSQEELDAQKTYDLSDAENIAKYQLDYLFLDLFYSLIEDFLFAHNIVFDDFDVSCFTSPEQDYLIKISYLRTPWDIIQKLRDMTCLTPGCPEEIYQEKLCSSHFQKHKLNNLSDSDFQKYQDERQGEDQKLYQQYSNELELEKFYKKANQDIPLVINFPVFDNYQQLTSMLDEEDQNKIKEYENNLDDDNEDSQMAPVYLNFFLIPQPKEMHTENLLEIEFPVEEGDDDLSDSDISIDNLSEMSLELEPEDIVDEEVNMEEDEQLDQLILDCNPLENMENQDESGGEFDYSSLENSSDDSDDESEIDLDNDEEFQKLKEEIEKRIT